MYNFYGVCCTVDKYGHGPYNTSWPAAGWKPMSRVIAIVDYRLEFCPTLAWGYNKGELTGE